MSAARVAVVTGAATGIGRACAESLAGAGFTVVAAYRTREAEIQSVVAGLPGSGHAPFRCDVADPGSAPALIAFAEGHGPVEALVNAAGTYGEHPWDATGYDGWREAWDRTLAVNLLGPVNLCYHAARAMAPRGRGKLINITSRGAFRGEPDAPAYGASKSALNSASQSLARALGPRGICVYAIAPGWVDTPMASGAIHGPAGDAIRAQSPLGRVGRPEEIARLVAFLAGEGTEYLTGAIFDMNGASFFRN